MPAAEARRLAEEYLRRYGLEGISSKRGPALTNEQKFCVMLLRAIMVRDAILIIDQPYKILIYSKVAGYLDDLLKVIDDSFKECYIFDLPWNKDRYRITDAS
jgi:ABC-type nitrate/sulfonate/bicarbonate transport system ATPase subunit